MASFNEINQQWLIRFLEHRIGDRRIIRLVQKWLKAGILEDGVVSVSDRGTGQGSADEQSGTASCGAICGGAERSGAGGAKGGDQGECGPAKHAPDAEPGKRVTGAGTHTQSGNAKEEGEVHRALPPHRHRSLGGGVLRTCAERSPRRGSDDVEGLRGRHRAQSRGSARPGPTRSVSGTAEPAGLHSQAGWTAAPARGRSP